MDYIISKMKNNIPVVVAVGNPNGSHALLCYKIEVYNSDKYKLYVLDTNLVYSELGKDIEKRTYILVWDEKGNQVFTYNPKINNHYVYRGQYNSFIPEAFLSPFFEYLPSSESESLF